MTETGDLSEDRGFKALFTSYPLETIEVFAPELLAERGAPVAVTVLAQESALPDLGEPSRFLDVALLASWPDGRAVVITLIEHWSEARKVDLRRVLWYVADLALRHPHAVILPVILVTDSSAREVPGRLELRVANRVTVLLEAQVTRITAADLPRLRALQNRVAAILAVLASHDAIEALLTCVQDLARHPGPHDDIERFLPFAMKLAKLPVTDAPRFRRRLEEAGMINVITEMKKEALAAGKAEGKAEGQLNEIRRLVAKGRLTIDAARSEISELVECGMVPKDIAEETLSQLG